jgi:hypothetical protein
LTKSSSLPGLTPSPSRRTSAESGRDKSL